MITTLASGIVAFFFALVPLAMICEPYKLTKRGERAILKVSGVVGMVAFLLSL